MRQIMNKPEMPEELWEKMMDLKEDFNSDHRTIYTLGFEQCFELMSERMKLKPISEAPKDRTEILLYDVYDKVFRSGHVINGKVYHATFMGHKRSDNYCFTHWSDLPDIGGVE